MCRNSGTGASVRLPELRCLAVCCLLPQLAREQKLRDLLHSPTSSPKHSAPGALQWLSSAGKAPYSPAKGQQQQWRPGSPLLPRTAAAEGGSGGYVGVGEPYKALQQQLLSDVDAVRKRQKPDFIRCVCATPARATQVAAYTSVRVVASATPRWQLCCKLSVRPCCLNCLPATAARRSQLRKGLVTQCSIRASPGQALLLEHTLTNCIGRDAVFELRVSHPQELTAVESLEELRDLQQTGRIAVISTTAAAAAAAAAGPASPIKGVTATAAGGMGASPLQLRQLAHQAAAAAAAGGGGVAAAGGRQLVNRGRIFLGANESVVIPLRYLLQYDVQSSTAGPGSGGKQSVQLQRQHTVVVEFVPLGLDWPVSILEVAVQPEPAVVDRTLRYHCPERELLHVEVALADLPGASGPLLAAAAAGRLTIAASRADVGVSVLSTSAATGEQQTAAGTNQQQQQRVCLRYRCGDVREAVQFTLWLYGSTAMGQPLEAWQVRVQEESP